MPWQIGTIYHGFRLTENRSVNEINSTAKIFRHEKSGARLLFLENDDDNKVFSISFRTPPRDSTGVAHILEHSVLCGSRKFPTKKPFVELVKGSLNTYLNAMTFPDKTMYPVASRNAKDFRNLMDVYLDAVFYPKLLLCPEILMQEGWHYELKTREEELRIKGVVYNEMKGVYSSPDSLLQKSIFASLFPATPYGVQSGGDPDVIPQLTQEQFVAFYKQYYHPANSYIYLYGDLDILDTLKFLDEEYLSRFQSNKVDSALAVQPAFDEMIERIIEYPVSPTEQTEDKTFLSLNYVVGRATDREMYLAFQILEHLLLETPAGPLKQALLNARVGKDVFGAFTPSILQPVLTVGVTGSNEEQQAKFTNTVYQTLKKLISAGIDKKLVESSINIFEFALREANYGNLPKGLVYGIKCMDSWLYDEDPLMHLEYEPTLQKIKTALSINYFEKLMEKYLLQNPHRSLVILKPKRGLAEEKAEELRQCLAKYKAELLPEEIDRLVEQTGKLKERQETPDSPEQLAAIPLLDLKDIEPRAERLPLVEREERAIPVLFHPLFTNKIVYVSLYFDTRAVPQQSLPYVYLLAEMLGKVDTEKYSYTALAKEININTGGIAFDVAAYSEKETDTVYHPRFRVKAKALVEKLPQMFGLMGQIIGHSRFSDTHRLKELVLEVKSGWELNLFRVVQQVVASRVLAYFSPVSRYREAGLLSFYKFLADLEKNFAGQAEEIALNLETVAKLIFNRENLLVSVAVDEANYARFQETFPILADYLGQQPFAPRNDQLPFPSRNEGLMTSAKVQYVAKGANFRRLGYSYHGSLKVLETILRYDYLWNRIREQGGAYGAFAQFERSGNMVFASYRDPNLKETLAVFDEIADYLRHFQVTEREMTKYIIGTISRVDMPLTPALKGEQATEYYIRKISYADIQRERDEILATRQDDIRRLANLVDAAMRENHLCVLGNEQKIKENKDVFNRLLNVFD